MSQLELEIHLEMFHDVEVHKIDWSRPLINQVRTLDVPMYGTLQQNKVCMHSTLSVVTLFSFVKIICLSFSVILS